MNAVADAVNIARIAGVPEGGEMAKVGPGGEEELEGDVLRSGWVIDEDVRLVVGGDSGA